MKKYLFTLSFLSLFSAMGASAVDFEPMEMSRMVRSADLAVSGSVKAASTTSVTLSVSEQFFGPDVGDEVTILRNKDWSGAGGPGIFRIGRSIVLFPGRTRDSVSPDKPVWRTLGIENEAVLPIDDNEVFFSGAMPGLKVGTHDIDGVTLSAHAFDLADFAKAVKAYRECFGPVEQDSSYASNNIQCSEIEFEALQNETELGRLLTGSSIQK